MPNRNKLSAIPRVNVFTRLSVNWDRQRRSGKLQDMRVRDPLIKEPRIASFKIENLALLKSTCIFSPTFLEKSLKICWKFKITLNFHNKSKSKTLCWKHLKKSLGSTKPSAVEKQTLKSYCFAKITVWDTINCSTNAIQLLNKNKTQLLFSS